MAVSEYLTPVAGTYLSSLFLSGVLGWAVYQVYLHPLAKFPGPKLAALTSLYEDYFQWSHEGTFPLVLERLHARYGDFVRIGPNEIHVVDPDCFDEIFNFNPEIDKRSLLGGRRGGGGFFGQATVEDSKLHRRPYNPPFSRQAVIKKETLIRDKIRTIMDVLDRASGTDQVIDLSSYYRALTTDVIASFAFGKDMDLLHNLGKAERLYAVWRGEWRRMARYEPLGLRARVLPLMQWLRSLFPAKRGLDPQSLAAFNEYQEEMKTYIYDTLDAIKKPEQSDQPPAFHEALRSKHVTDVHFTPDALFANGNVVFLAGSETTASSMGAGAYHLLANPSVLARVQAELDKAWADGPPSWIALERIPLLRGVVMETLRLDLGVSRRFARINWQSDMSLNDWVIPQGYTVSMSHRFSFFNEKIFPDSQKFDPDRWTDEATPYLSKYMHPFSKGTRQCVAYSIANAELYLAYADIHRHFDLELFETTREDVDCTVDRILSFPKAGKMTVKVKSKGRRAN